MQLLVPLLELPYASVLLPAVVTTMVVLTAVVLRLIGAFGFVASVRGRRLAYLSALAYVAGGYSIAMGWVRGLNPEQSAEMSRIAHENAPEVPLGIATIRADLTSIPLFNPASWESVGITAFSRVTAVALLIGAFAAISVLICATLCRPAIMLMHTATFGLIATCAAASMALIEAIDFTDVELAPVHEHHRSFLMDVASGPGFRLFVFTMIVGTCLSAIATVECYRTRYGTAWDAVAARGARS